MKTLPTIVLVVLASMQLLAQAPLGFNYQGIARQADGTPISEQTIGIRISIVDGPQGDNKFVEEHFLQTNEFGLFTTVVGQGNGNSTLNSVDWALGNLWLQIELDPDNSGGYILMGSQQLMSVPYALFAQQSGQGLSSGYGIAVNNGTISNVLPDRPITLTGIGNVQVTGSYPNFTIDGTANTDADSDPTNEIQSLSKSGNTVSLSNGGGSFTDAVDDADNDATNEIQDLQLAGNILTVTKNGTATTIDLSAYLDNTDTQLTETEVDAYIANNGYLTAEIDGDASNEIQTLSLNTNTLSLTSGGSVDLSEYLDDTNTQLTEAEVDAFTNDNGYLTTEVDGSVTNEIQDLALMGNDLEITNNTSATAIDLSGYLDNTDEQDLSLSAVGTNRTIGISGGSGVVVDVADNDNNSSNELQTISKAGNTVTLSDGGGSFTDEVDDADSDVSNEIQNLSLNVNSLDLTSGGSVDLSGYLDNTDTQNLSNVLAQGASAGNVIITNLGDPVNSKDAVNLQYLEAKDATDYAFKSDISDAGTGASLTFDLSTIDFDEGNLITTTQIVITESGIYFFSIKGTSSGNALLVINLNNTTDYPVGLINLGKYFDTVFLKLSVGDIIELRANSTTNGELFTLELFGYKI